MGLRRRNVNRVETRPAEERHGGEHMGVGEIGLDVFGEIAPQHPDALALDADDLDAGVGLSKFFGARTGLGSRRHWPGSWHAGNRARSAVTSSKLKNPSDIPVASNPVSLWIPA